MQTAARLVMDGMVGTTTSTGRWAAGRPALAQPIGTFEASFNHRNSYGGVPYNFPVSGPQWQNARNDLPPAQCPPYPLTVFPPTTLTPPGSPPAWIRAMHLSLIPPTAPLSGEPFGLGGRVLVFDGNETNDPDGTQFWSIMDPVKPDSHPDKFWNFELSGIRAGRGASSGRLSDFGCAGHTWMQNGKLFVAGGTSRLLNPNPPPLAQIEGTYFAYVFDPGATPPGNGMWSRVDPDMQGARWYPSCALAWDEGQGERILVPGGILKTTTPPSLDHDSYEAFDPLSPTPLQWKGWGPTGANLLFQGTESLIPAQTYLHFYPRLRLLSNGSLFRSSMPMQGAVVHHVDGPGTTDAGWSARGVATPQRWYGASLLFPNISPLHTDAVLEIGGQDQSVPGTTAVNTVAISKPTRPVAGGFNTTPLGYDWDTSFLPAMVWPRVYHNAVTLPDASIVVFGGRTAHDGGFIAQVERYAGGMSWIQDAVHLVVRDYHSTALLLPDGSVLVAGGDSRCWDYTIYKPPYLQPSDYPKPVFTAATPPKIEPALYNTSYNVGFSLSGGSTVAKVVLMRPGSTTHHSDFDQRYVQLETEVIMSIPPQTGTYARFTTPIAPPGPSNPADSNAAPPGWYMLFLVSNHGIPSVAGWIKLVKP